MTKTSAPTLIWIMTHDASSYCCANSQFFTQRGVCYRRSLPLWQYFNQFYLAVDMQLTDGRLEAGLYERSLHLVKRCLFEKRERPLSKPFLDSLFNESWTLRTWSNCQDVLTVSPSMNLYVHFLKLEISKHQCYHQMLISFFKSPNQTSNRWRRNRAFPLR